MKGYALITGASAGLGAEFARQLAAAGYPLILVARRKAKLEALAAILQHEHGVDVVVVEADLSLPEAVGEVTAATQALPQPVVFLVNNAGSGGPALGEDDWQPLRAYFELMLMSCVALCHEYLPAMVAGGYGRIVNVSSVAGRLPRAGDNTYGPIKAYLVALSEALNATHKGDNVHVSALCPGFTHTEFHADGELAEMKAATPSFIWYDAQTVVSEGLRAVEKGRPLCVSGRLYRWLDPLFQSRLFRRVARISR